MAAQKKQPKKGKSHRTRVRPGQQSNKNNLPMNLKLRTPEERLAMFKSYCKHLEDGFSRESFPDMSYEAVEEYVANFSDELDAEEMHKAWRTGRKRWEVTGQKGCIGAGNYKNFKSTAYIFIMQNMYGLKQNVNVTGKTEQDITHTIVEIAMPDNGREYNKAEAE